MKSSLSKIQIQSLRKPLTKANSMFAKEHPGEGAERQPVHTVYGA